MREGALTKTGGPVGYNYALKTQLDKMNVNYIHFLPGGKPYRPGIGKKIKNTWYGNIMKSIKDFIRWTNALYSPSKKPIVDLNQYDIVHFHSCLSMYSVRSSLKNYKGKVILTSHTPRVSYQEIISMITPWGQKNLKWYYKKMEKFDHYAFNRADYILFPCPEAEEPYYHTWEEFSTIKAIHKNKFRYLLTGTYECKAKLSRNQICQKYGIPENAFIICYVGRHNEIKGYDQLKRIGNQILSQNKEIYFLIAGEEYPLKGLEHAHWIEIGWTNDPHSIIGASDIFILPNKETYFDLIMLEVLSLGKIVIASDTGGNKYFKNKLGDGVQTYNNEIEAINKINNIFHKGKDNLKNLEAKNKQFFKEHLSLDVFANNYINFYNSI